jgi:hypothetical protein
MPRVTFEISPQKEFKYHQLFRKYHKHTEKYSLFAFEKELNSDRVIKKAEGFWDDQDRAKIKEIENIWGTIEQDYFRLVEKITGVQWPYDKYKAFFSCFLSIDRWVCEFVHF